MPDYRRLRKPGATVYFTVNLADPNDDLLVREIDRLRFAFHATLRERSVRLNALVVLPDHLHAVWTLPSQDADYSGRWGKIKSLFVRDLPAKGLRSSHVRRGEKGIWQRRFWEHHIRDEADYRTHVAYCWFNPVKHGYARRAVDWPYSSIHRDIRQGRVAPDWSCQNVEGEFGERAAGTDP